MSIGLERTSTHITFLAVLFQIYILGVSWPFDEWNRNFLKDFAGIEMPKRTLEDTSYIPDPSLIHSGDTFDILRLDGLDPMIAWAMGAATGKDPNHISLDFKTY